MSRSRAVRVVLYHLVLVPFFAAGPAHAALVTDGAVLEVSVQGRSGLARIADLYDQRIDRVLLDGPETLTLTRSGAATYSSATVARASSTADLVTTFSFQPLEIAATASGGFTAAGERLAGHPGPEPTSVSGVSELEVFVDVTDLPAAYSFSGTLYGPAEAADEGHQQRGDRIDHGVPFSFTGTLAPGSRNRFRVTAAGAVGIPSPASLDSGARFEGVALRITQVPEPGSLFALAGAVAVPLLRRRRT